MQSNQAVAMQAAAATVPRTGQRASPIDKWNAEMQPEGIAVDDRPQPHTGGMLLVMLELPPSEVQSKFRFTYGPCETALYGFWWMNGGIC